MRFIFSKVAYSAVSEYLVVKPGKRVVSGRKHKKLADLDLGVTLEGFPQFLQKLLSKILTIFRML